ncbi:phage/plasmid primase, P4 family [Streptomyces sp. NPDC091299]|uniref:phage/plasmid primase, P4 family n=1 Tax=Streptomyces sp. NPDC091299 TaxID=3155302 RepID=UPI0034418757
MTQTAPIPPGASQGNPLLTAALFYASAGWAVFPLRPGTKVPATSNGFKAATTDVNVITDWWTQTPDANIGIATGLSNLFVIDVDTKEDKKGAETIAALQAEFGALPHTWTVRTWSGGWQHYFKMPASRLSNSTGTEKAGLGPDVDTRGDGGYVVAAPSIVREKGTEGRYTVKTEDKVRPADLPPWVPEKLSQTRKPYVPPGRPSTIPVAQRGAQTLNGPQGAPEALRKRVAALLQEIRDLPVGGPATQPVNDRALWVGHFVPRYLQEEEIRAQLRAAVESWEDGHEKGLRAIETGLRDGMADPREWEDRRAPDGTGGKYFARIDGDRTFLAASLATDVLDIGALAAGIDSLMWEYRDGVWVPSKEVARHRAALLLGENYRRSYAVNAEDVVRSRVPEIDCEPIPEVINFRNGLFYWQTGMLLPHSPDVLSTVQLPVDWDPSATCPEFDAFLGQVVHADTVDMVWELIGYLMYSGNPLHKAVMLTGTGRNGKGTFLRTVEGLLGKQNITSASLIDLVNTRFTTASLFGKIANIAGDIDGTYLENTATFKAITGQDMISAEHKGRDRFDFTPWAVPVFSANKIPGSADTTVGYLSRWVVLHFPNDFTGREDRTLDQRLKTKAELAGIAVKAVAALRRLMARHDFELPPSAQDAREEFIRRVDQVRTWISECTAPDPASWAPRTALYAVYKNWASRDGHGTLKATEFYDRLESAGVRPAKVNGTRGFAGIRVTDTAEGTGRPR